MEPGPSAHPQLTSIEFAQAPNATLLPGRGDLFESSLAAGAVLPKPAHHAHAMGWKCHSNAHSIARSNRPFYAMIFADSDLFIQ